MLPSDRRLVGSTAVAHAMFHFYELSIPLFVVVWLDVFDVTTTVIGLVVTSGYVLIGAGAVPSGLLADAYGSRSLLIVSLVGMAAGFLILSVAPDLLILGVGLVVWGSAAGLYHPAGLSLLTRGATQQGTALAYHGLAGNIGTAVGPFVTAVLLTFFEWRVSAALLALPVLPGVVVAVRTRPGSVGEQETSGLTSGLRTFRRGSARLLTVVFGLLFAVMCLHGIYARGVLTFLPELLDGFSVLGPIELHDRSFAPGRYLYAGVLLLGGVGQYVGGRLTDHVETERLLVGAYGCLCVGSIVFAAITDALLPLLAVCGVLGFLIYLTAPVRQTLVAEHTVSDIHGTSFGYTYLGVFGFGALGATVGGVLLSVGGSPVFFVAFAGIAALVATVGVVISAR